MSCALQMYCFLYISLGAIMYKVLLFLLCELGAAGGQAKRASLPIYFNSAAYHCDHVVCELSDGQWTETIH